MKSIDHWNAKLYDSRYAFVSRYGNSLVENYWLSWLSSKARKSLTLAAGPEI